MVQTIPGSFLEYAISLCEGDHEKRSKVLSMYTANFGLVDFNAKVRERDRVRLKLLTQFYEISRDKRLRGQLYNILKAGQFYTQRDKLSFEHRLMATMQDYHYGRLLERTMNMGKVTDRFYLSFEPGQNYNNTEGMWWLVLADMKAESPVIARISVNIHKEGRNRVMSITEIHGTEGKKAALDAFLKSVRMPWPIFMIRALQYHARKTGVHTIRGISDSTQPFFHNTAFYSGKELEAVRSGQAKEYSLYTRTFKILGFHAPNGGRFFEQKLADVAFKDKRTKIFEQLFTPLERPIPPQLPLRKGKNNPKPPLRRPPRHRP